MDAKKLILGLGVFVCAVTAQTNLFFNGLFPIGGRFILGAEHALTQKLEAVISARYFEQELGLVTGYIYPYNLDRMYDVSGTAGFNLYPFETFRAFYGTAEIEGGYHSTRMAGGVDSTFTEGYYIAPAVKAGYRFNLRRRFSIAPELGAFYKWNTADFTRLRQQEGDGDFPFEATREGIRRENTGLHPLAALKVAIRF